MILKKAMNIESGKRDAICKAAKKKLNSKPVT